MTVEHTQDASQAAREQILSAAQMRFLRFGYHKTTMAEVAEDAGMSAANLYRYFANKQEIAAECAGRCMNERLQRLRAVARDSRLAPGEKLTAYALAMIEHTQEMADPASKIGELVATIARNRPQLIHDKMSVHHGLIAEILSAGIDAGEFEVDDVIETARHVYSALVVFDVPLFIGLFDRDEFDRRARGVSALLRAGLGSGASTPTT
jgi:AcrR family transcriptional regulator